MDTVLVMSLRLMPIKALPHPPLQPMMSLLGSVDGDFSSTVDHG